MARLTNHQELLQLIKTLNGLPRTGCTNACGHTVQTIFEAHNTNFPESPLTLEQVAALMQYGASRGVFRKSEFTDDGDFYYHINYHMGGLNTSNFHFVAEGFQFDLGSSSPGYLPCGQYEGPQQSPYASTVVGYRGFATNNAVNADGSLLAPTVRSCPGN